MLVEALLHGSELKTNPPFPEWTSRHAIAVGHPEAVHLIEDLARQLHLLYRYIVFSTMARLL